MDIVKYFVLKENKLLYMYLILVYYVDILVNKGSKCINNKIDQEFLLGSNNLLDISYDFIYYDEICFYFGQFVYV